MKINNTDDFKQVQYKWYQFIGVAKRRKSFSRRIAGTEMATGASASAITTK